MGLVEARPGAGTFVRRQSARLRQPDYGWQTTTLGAPADRIPTISTPLRDIPADAIGLHSGYPARELTPRTCGAISIGQGASRGVGVAAGADRRNRGPAILVRGRARGYRTIRGDSRNGTRCSHRAGPERTVAATCGHSWAPDGPVVMESPTYWGAMTAAAQAGATVVPIASGPGGPDPDDLARALDLSGATVFYAQPNFANPTGAQWSAEIRQGVLPMIGARGRSSSRTTGPTTSGSTRRRFRSHRATIRVMSSIFGR